MLPQLYTTLGIDSWLAKGYDLVIVNLKESSKMANKRGKKVDTTYLSVNQAANRGFLHRDYLAHTLRWTHVMRYLNPTRAERILDAGCGREAPLAQVMYANRQAHHSYLGVDVGRIEPVIQYNGKFQPQLMPNTDVLDLTAAEVEQRLGGHPTLVTSFEVLEHMEPDHAYKFLRRLADLGQPPTKDEPTTYLISTPVYDERVGAADNHVNEWTYKAMLWLLRAAGFVVVAHWGTFASQRDYLPELEENPAWLKLFNQLKEYYNADVISNLFAPLFPDHSRNVLWKLRLMSTEAEERQRDWHRSLLSTGAKAHETLGSSQDTEAWDRLAELLD